MIISCVKKCKNKGTKAFIKCLKCHWGLKLLDHLKPSIDTEATLGLVSSRVCTTLIIIFSERWPQDISRSNGQLRFDLVMLIPAQSKEAGQDGDCMPPGSDVWDRKKL